MKKHIQNISELNYKINEEYLFIIKNIVPYQSEDPIEVEIIFTRSCFKAAEFMNLYKSTMAVLSLHVVEGENIIMLCDQWYDDDSYLGNFAAVRPLKVEQLMRYIENNSLNDSFTLSELI